MRVESCAENILLTFKEAFDTEDKEMLLEELTTFVNSKIAKSKAKKSFGVQSQGFAYEKSKLQDVDIVQDESQGNKQTYAENNSCN